MLTLFFLGYLISQPELVVSSLHQQPTFPWEAAAALLLNVFRATNRALQYSILLMHWMYGDESLISHQGVLLNEPCILI